MATGRHAPGPQESGEAVGAGVHLPVRPRLPGAPHDDGRRVGVAPRLATEVE